MTLKPAPADPRIPLRATVARARVEPWRRLALFLLLLGMLGTSVELALLEHYEDPRQWIPLASLGVGCIIALVVALRPSASAVHVLRFTMAAYLVVAAAGVFFHLKSNLEFELELHPSMAGRELAIEVLKGAMPALAPSAMAYLGLLGLLVCFRHPALAPEGGAT